MLNPDRPRLSVVHRKCLHFSGGKSERVLTFLYTSCLQPERGLPMKKIKNGKVAMAVALLSLLSSLFLSNSYASQPVLTEQDIPVCADSAVSAHCLAVEHQFFINGAREKDLSHLGDDLQKAGANPSRTSSVGFVISASKLRAIYGTPSGSINTNSTIAIVDVWDATYSISRLINDFNTYQTNSVYGNGLKTPNASLLKIFNQSGQAINAAPCTSCGSNGWGSETALDIDMVNAICPTCTINLYLANTASFPDLSAAVTSAAASPSVSAISNSYGGGGNTSGNSYPAYNNAAGSNGGIAVTASSGDSGYGLSDPADYSNVIGVGGTTLASATSGVGQTIWTGAGSGCSTNNAKSYQTSVTNCSGKAVSDVSAVANPSTGVAVSFNGNWYQFGGTSVASPIIATYMALTSQTWRAQTASSVAAKAATWLWSLSSASFIDPKDGGSNGRCTTSIWWCHTVTGWDGPTGLGTPMPGSVF